MEDYATSSESTGNKGLKQAMKNIVFCVALLGSAVAVIQAVVQNYSPCDDAAANYVADLAGLSCRAELATVYKVIGKEDDLPRAGTYIFIKDGKPSADYLVDDGVVVNKDLGNTIDGSEAQFMGKEVLALRRAGFTPAVLFEPAGRGTKVALKDIPQSGSYLVSWWRLRDPSRIETIDYSVVNGKIESRESVTTWHSD